jgi:hypothetical protein
VTATSPEPAASGPLDHALAYANVGLRVLPIRPGAKAPSLPAWVDHATTDPATIQAWWTGLYAGHGVGLALGQLPDGRWAFAVDIDAHDPTAVGADTWADLEDAYGDAPDTVEAITGGGGRHLLYAAPAEIRNGRLGPGIDLRGAGGQIVVEPTMHPSGQPYTWVDGQAPWDHPIADAPGWLVAMATPDEPPTPPAATAPPADPGERPGDAWAAGITWAALLEGDGWTLHHTDRDGETYWVRPGKERRDGASATVGHKGSDVLKVFTTNAEGLDPEATYTKVGYLAATRFAGDHSATASWLRSQGHGGALPAPDLSWIPDSAPSAPGDAPAGPDPLTIRWVPELDADMPPEPPELIEGFLRAGEMVVVGAPRAIGKTWLGYNLAARLAEGTGRFLGNLEVRQRARVLYLQGELDEWGSATRWKLLTGAGRPLPQVAESFDRVRFRALRRRQVRTVDGHSVTDEYADAEIDARLERAIVDHEIDVVIVDPWAVYLAASENSNDEVEAVLGGLREITLRTGVAWVIVHHITGKAERSSWTEPEDLWRGATRLADWASTRVTVLPHYTEAQYKEAGLSRREARRHVDVHFLRRSTPTDGFSMRLDGGWWQAWTPEPQEASTPLRNLAKALHLAGGTWGSLRDASVALGMRPGNARKILDDAARAGLVVIEEGPRGALTVTLQSVSNPYAATASRPRPDRAPSQWDADGTRSQSVPDQDIRHSPRPTASHDGTRTQSVSDQHFSTASHSPPPTGEGLLGAAPPPEEAPGHTPHDDAGSSRPVDPEADPAARLL